MRCIVQKYGGSSVADTEKLKKIASIIYGVKSAGYDVAVVVSAMSKTTNNLIDLARNISPDPPKRELDMLLSTGERTTMSLLCMALNALGIEAISLTGSQSGIITNDRHNNARVIEVRPFRVLDELEKGKVVVVGGFQGVSYKRDITTLGRGGSDTTAVALAAAINAERCEIYSDVDGVYSADPSAVKDARHLPEISYQMMQEMSLAGAKVLNAQAVQFAKEAQIAIYARSTFSPGRETIVRTLAPGLTKGIKAIVSENDVFRIKLFEEDPMTSFRKISDILEEKNILIKELSISKDSVQHYPSSVSFVISCSNAYGWENVKDLLKKSFGKKISIEEGLGALSLIGEGMGNDVSVVNETIKMLTSSGIEIFGVTTTSFRISFLLKNEEIKKGVLICHEKWIEETSVAT
ncbi:MAG: aspartate kinase [Clostridiales bacterium]